MSGCDYGLLHGLFHIGRYDSNRRGNSTGDIVGRLNFCNCLGKLGILCGNICKDPGLLCLGSICSRGFNAVPSARGFNIIISLLTLYDGDNRGSRECRSDRLVNIRINIKLGNPDGGGILVYGSRSVSFCREVDRCNRILGDSQCAESVMTYRLHQSLVNWSLKRLYTVNKDGRGHAHACISQSVIKFNSFHRLVLAILL